MAKLTEIIKDLSGVFNSSKRSDKGHLIIAIATEDAKRLTQNINDFFINNNLNKADKKALAQFIIDNQIAVTGEFLSNLTRLKGYCDFRKTNETYAELQQNLDLLSQGLLAANRMKSETQLHAQVKQMQDGIAAALAQIEYQLGTCPEGSPKEERLNTLKKSLNAYRDELTNGTETGLINGNDLVDVKGKLNRAFEDAKASTSERFKTFINNLMEKIFGSSRPLLFATPETSYKSGKMTTDGSSLKMS
ncbi:Uncharacterised protein [Legionella lansingensis]|uniref:Uncharacterized protein n=1 Tax=Legionella lansingensis TaxID=45067 RepID=A0A0W0VYA5_9GAMM|nr:hypothetical protein [Legionella lansingensis]KTD24969.1 hypothetical protein Llan_0274 [Legionella lansingensis]SNV48202.1 Uncharacterised protein [Legionella lansingensis]